MDGLRAVNVYVLETEQGLTLVDGGWAVEAARRRLDEALASLGRTVRDITRFLVTHVHRDHYTQAVVVRREVGAHVSLGLGDKETLDLVAEPDGYADPTIERLERAGAEKLAAQWRSHVAGADRPDPASWEPPDTWLDRDHALTVGSRTLDAVSTPGHTRGHFVFADRSAGLLFAGDHVLPTITPSIGFEPAYAEQPLGDFLASLAKVRAMPDLRLLPAHGPVTGSSHARVEELVAHHDERLRLCRASVGTGPRTALDVARDLPWTRRGRHLDDLDVFNAALAVMETAVHLDLLVARGDLVCGDADGVREYAAPSLGP
ncbi:MAG: MBL fold metallo-hydrolase [Nocardioidaceae bacterium]|nr:MBL fold metallo-hydrolase [Nocardioidaceae bacterium]NUS49491.1 MBL fold metallo-hydrolase [Nocardioidaceae bacterium]